MKKRKQHEKSENKSLYFCTVGAAISFFIFCLTIYLSGFSLHTAVNSQNLFIKGFLSQSSVPAVLSEIASFFVMPFIALIFLTLGFAFLSSFGYFHDIKKVGIVAALLGSLFSILFFGLSPLSLTICAGLIVASVYIIAISNVYAKELKKWVFFRTGSNSLSKAMMIFNIFVFIGIVLSVYSALPAYQNSFRSGFVDSILSITPQDLGELSNYVDEETARQQLNNYVESTIDSSPLFSSLIRWLPIITGFSAWVVLEFLRAFVFTNLGGIFTSILIRLNKKFEKAHI